MLPYDLITFDCYGTLIDWEAGMEAAIARLARQLGVRLKPAKLVPRYIQIEFGLEQGAYRSYRDILCLGLRLLFEEQGIRLGARQSAALVAALPRWPAFPETSRVLRGLRKQGYRLAVLSNVDDALLRKSLKHIDVHFDHMVTAQQVRSYKPCRRHWERMLSLSKVPRRRILHVAASQLHDIIPAKTLGFTSVWINRNRERGLPGARPHHTFEDLTGLTELLSKTADRGTGPKKG